MEHPLKLLEVSNFRTIRGSVSLPLDASVVLIHGDNGAGKTSLLSAVELAMTGEIQALNDAEPRYIDHLPHVDGGPCGIRLAASEGTIAEGPARVELQVANGRVTGAPLLGPQERRFFTERCFLAQSALGRLLELYQNPEGRGESSLVRFVNELLGLDNLDAIITGLHAAGDERRIRKVVPEWEGQQSSIQKLESAVTAGEKRLAALRSRVRAEYDQLRQELEVGEATPQPGLAELAAFEARLASDGSEDDLARLSRQAARLSELVAQVARFPAMSEASESVVAEITDAQRAAASWRVDAGPRLTRAFEAASNLMGYRIETRDDDPAATLEQYLKQVSSSLDREVQLLEAEAERADQVTQLTGLLEARRGELARLDSELAALTVNWDGLVEALAAIVPHIEGDECPVCGRDFAEVSDEPLVDRTTRLIAEYAAGAARVQAIAEERSALQAAISNLATTHASLLDQLRTVEDRAESENRVRALSGLKDQLSELETLAAEGTARVRAVSDLDRRVVELSRVEAAVTTATSAIAEVWADVFGADVPIPSGPTDALDRMQAAVERRTAELEAHVATRAALRDRLAGLNRLVLDEAETETRLASDKAALSTSKNVLAKARTRMQNARGISSAAAQARSAIVATVFNGSLNKAWHDLFIRLAPDEPYVPSFGVPTTDRRLTEVQLETVHRFGGQGGGTPGAMLSAGNLNTAALTLFLALHLSVEPRIECIVLDDPVQSMDEVHVSQFAALVRTLSRQLGRQVILAVHERSLFEYLRLELSPSASGSTLITAELQRHEGADTECVATLVPWEDEVPIRTAPLAG